EVSEPRPGWGLERTLGVRVAEEEDASLGRALRADLSCHPEAGAVRRALADQDGSARDGRREAVEVRLGLVAEDQASRVRLQRADLVGIRLECTIALDDPEPTLREEERDERGAREHDQAVAPEPLALRARERRRRLLVGRALGGSRLLRLDIRRR